MPGARHARTRWGGHSLPEAQTPQGRTGRPRHGHVVRTAREVRSLMGMTESWGAHCA
jgi:hypothetical protein